MQNQIILQRRARELRRNMTRAEYVLWDVLHARKLGVKFRRQHVLGNYILDFISIEAQLVIEVDGEQHADNAYDARRDAWLRELGFTVLRFWNRDVLFKKADVVEVIQRALAESGMAPLAPPSGEDARHASPADGLSR